MVYNSIVLEMLGAETLITLIFIMWLIVGAVLFEGVTINDVQQYLKPIIAFFKRVWKAIAKQSKVAWKWTKATSIRFWKWVKKTSIQFVKWVKSLFQPTTKKAKPIIQAEPAKNSIGADWSTFVDTAFDGFHLGQARCVSSSCRTCSAGLAGRPGVDWRNCARALEPLGLGTKGLIGCTACAPLCSSGDLGT
jgi:hypothetical protein